jgi:thymidylate kinase
MKEQLKTEYKISWESLHAEIFSELIDEFKLNKIRYFILRNYEGLPEINTSKDIDIIIEPGSYTKASRILYNVFRRYGISFHRRVQYERVRCWFGMDVEKKFSIHIDLIEGYLSKGFEVFTFDFLYRNTKEYNGFRVLNDSYDAVMLLYYKVIGTKQLNERYKKKISFIFSENKDEIKYILDHALSEKQSKMIYSSLEKGEYHRIINNAHIISKSSKKRVFFNKPLKTFVNVFRFLAEKFHRIIICPRRFQNFIAVLGADGTGKTTFIDGLTKAIAFYNVSDDSKSHVYHHRPTLLPNLGAVGEKAGVMEEDKDFTNPHRAKPASFLSSFVRMTYYWLDYAIGAPLMLRKDVQFDRYTIYDRYIYDFLIDPGRSRINLPYWLRKMFTNLVIQPRIVFILLTDAETIYNRKQELTIPEINRQLREFKKLSKSSDRFVILDASQSPEQIIQQAMCIIIEKFTKQIV